MINGVHSVSRAPLVFEGRELLDSPLRDHPDAVKHARRFWSCVQERDLPWDMKQSNHYKAGLEVYAPNFLCMQFGLVQMVPEIN